jgi:serine/threonine protein kinase
VFLARHIRSGINYALKALKKKTLILKKQLKYAITEAKVLKLANHPFIINLHYAFQTPNFLYLALDFCPGKDLSFHLAREVTFGEDETRIYLTELILAIDHLHSKSILYRDLKP